MNKVESITYLKDFKPSPFEIKSVHLTFKLRSHKTVVNAKILFNHKKSNHDLILDGLNLKLKKVSINNTPQKINSLIRKPDTLTIPKEVLPDGTFLWEAETVISPETNTALEGLYLSSGTFCTQCEAQGFRKITYFLDRPDILTVFTVRIESTEPVLLSNGNLIAEGRGFAEWHDPWPKPSYLFALVAGNLVSFIDTFNTRSGRKVDLKIYVKPDDLSKCSHAMNSLKRAMQWDEDEYQLEYDLDCFMIVAIDDFNMGAMENKGLNIFNSKYILADEKTATDKDYENIERIIAHEYFHNWTGNRITCRDWFQLCLKEGLTVFRDQQFSERVHGYAVKRIENVLALQNYQFREDDGPLAHPVRPTKYLEINNFYTATVYEKGAELIRMLKLIVGEKSYKQAMQEYFSTFDGKACTVEDFLSIFEQVTKFDLTQFALWYHQKGRPTVKVTTSYKRGTLTVEAFQMPGKTQNRNFKPMLIPIKIGLLDQNGQQVRGSKTFLLSKKKQSIKFKKLISKPITSTLRDFSAPIDLTQSLSDNELLVIGTNDPNLFNRWNALRIMSLRAVEKLISGEPIISDLLIKSITNSICSRKLNPAYKAIIATPPTPYDIFSYLLTRRNYIDPALIYKSIHLFNNALLENCRDYISNRFDSYQPQIEHSFNKKQADIRAFDLALLNIFSYCAEGIKFTKNFHSLSSNMTDEIGSLAILINHSNSRDEVDLFYRKWETNNNVIDKWFAIQAIYTKPEKSIAVVSELTKHIAFDLKNPNRFGSLIGAFATKNFGGFHQKDGKGYALVTDFLIKLDKLNPQTAARFCSSFDNFELFDPIRQFKMKEQLMKFFKYPNISNNCFEIISSILNKYN